MAQLPYKISPCPILEVTVEIKFSTTYPHNAIFGIFYNVFKDKFNQIESLPITQIPEEVRINDPNFKFKVFYKLHGNNYTIQIGYDVITLHCNEPYVGWNDFSVVITEFFSRVQSTGLINQVLSLSLQYINFFENDIFKNANVSIEVAGKKIDSGKSTIRIEIPHKEYIQVLQVANDIVVENPLKKSRKQGSLLDISLIVIEPIDFFNQAMVLINSLHDEEKEIFFELLKNNFLSTLNPQFES